MEHLEEVLIEDLILSYVYGNEIFIRDREDQPFRHIPPLSRNPKEIFIDEAKVIAKSLIGDTTTNTIVLAWNTNQPHQNQMYRFKWSQHEVVLLNLMDSVNREKYIDDVKKEINRLLQGFSE